MRWLLLLAALQPSAFAGSETPAPFGIPPSLSAATPLAELLKRPESFEGRDILLEGTARKVCAKKGCWMVLSDGDREIRITFKDYAFFLPKGSLGRRVRAQGLASRETVSVRDQRHFLKDEGAGRDEMRKIKTPLTTVSFVASGVAFLN